jgi:hypothetical protein
MAFNSAQITLAASTATPLLVQGTTGTEFQNVAGSLQDPIPVQILNNSGTAVWIGGPGVTASNGYPLLEGSPLTWNLYGTSEIPYAFSAGTPVIYVIIGRQ